jgi:hypothetical protein
MLNNIALIFIIIALPVILIRMKRAADKQDNAVMRDWATAAFCAGFGGFLGWKGVQARLDPSSELFDWLFPAASAVLGLIIGIIFFCFKITLFADRIEVQSAFRTKRFLLRDMLPSSMTHYDCGVLRFSGGRRIRVHMQYSGKSRFIGILRKRKFISKYYASEET